MSRSGKYFDGHVALEHLEFQDALHPHDSSLPSAVQSLENEELRLLLMALLSEWRTRTARGFHA
jgi:hypothetical protein